MNLKRDILQKKKKEEEREKGGLIRVEISEGNINLRNAITFLRFQAIVTTPLCDTLLQTMATIFKCVARVPDVVPESKRNVSHGDVELRRVPRLPSLPPSFRFRCLSILRRTIAFNEVKLKMRRNVGPAPLLLINVTWTWTCTGRIIGDILRDRLIEIV